MRLRSVGPEAPASNGPGAVRRDLVYRRLRDEAAQLPGVEAAGLISQPPLSDAGMSCYAAPSRRPEDRTRVELRGVTSHTFEALGIPVLEHGDLGRLDDGGEAQGVVVSETAAALLWPGSRALGRRLTLDWGDGQNREVIGVVGDLRHPSVPAEVQPTVYLPFGQVPQRAMTLVVRADGRQDPYAGVQARARALGSPLVVDLPTELPRAIAATIAEPRARALLVGALALAALLLAAVGTYSVVALAVEEAGYDSSVRLALGAHPRLLVRDTMADILKPASLGIALGLAGSLVLARALSGLLYGVGTRDPRTLLGTTAIMTLVVLIASYLPAHRLSTTDPAIALRAE
jgi:putative ABC transport system permease protein